MSDVMSDAFQIKHGHLIHCLYKASLNKDHDDENLFLSITSYKSLLSLIYRYGPYICTGKVFIMKCNLLFYPLVCTCI